MTIQDGMRIHDEAGVKRYRMPDLLTLEEMRLYFAGTYGVDVELKPLSDKMKEDVQGVGVLAVSPPMTDRDREHSQLRKDLGIEELESRLDIAVGELTRARELDSRVMTKEQFEEKYGEQPTPAPPEEDIEVEQTSPDNSDEVSGSVPAFESSEQKNSNPEDELQRLLDKDDKNE